MKGKSSEVRELVTEMIIAVYKVDCTCSLIGMAQDESTEESFKSESFSEVKRIRVRVDC